VALTVHPDGMLDIDFDGLSSAFWQPFQGSLSCLEGLVLNGLIQKVLYDTRHNEGTLLAARLHVPEGTCCNPPSIFYPTTLWGPAYGAGVAVGQALSRAFYAAGYREEATASSALSSGCTAGGIDQYGRSFGSHNMEFAAAGTPATAVADGLDTSGVEFNPEGDMGDAEIWEQMMPQVYLAREPRRDGGGFGRYRGGNGINSLYVMANTTEVQVGSFGSAPIFPTPGLMGGYPAACLVMWIGQDTNLGELIERRAPLPGGEGDDPARPDFVRMVEGRWECHPGANLRTRWVEPYDMFTAVTGDGGGFGDPIERDPQAVARDVQRGMTTARAARAVYCVALGSDGAVDEEGTERLRRERRLERLRDALPADEYRRRERERLLEGRIGTPVQRCYNDLLRSSPTFARRFREFWELPEGFVVPGEDG
jgi:acetone carboxylase alpha subunit